MKLSPEFQNFLYISGGAVFGANARHWVTGWLTAKLGDAFPYATLAVNFTGSFMLGLLLGAIANHYNFDPHIKLTLATGFLGAYTTFSTLEYESVNLMARGQWTAGLLNLGVSVVVGVIAAGLGLWLGGRL